MVERKRIKNGDLCFFGLTLDVGKFDLKENILKTFHLCCSYTLDFGVHWGKKMQFDPFSSFLRLDTA